MFFPPVVKSVAYEHRAVAHCYWLDVRGQRSDVRDPRSDLQLSTSELGVLCVFARVIVRFLLLAHRLFFSRRLFALARPPILAISLRRFFESFLALARPARLATSR